MAEAPPQTSQSRNGRNSRYLTEPERRSIIALVSTGVSQAQAARQFKVHPNTVNALCKSVRDVPNSPLSRRWREEQLPKAIAAVNAGLDHDEDPYKRAAIGVSVMRGLGQYKDESANVNNTIAFVTQIQALPEHLRQMFHSDTDVISPSTHIQDVVDTPPASDYTLPASDVTPIE